jgi:oligopeptide/dipeptide ABC transporter ATP-binding protein
VTALLEVADVRKYFPIGRRRLFGAAPPSLRAVDGVSLSVERGETLGLVGETGCGKSTLARCMTRLYDLTAGRVTFDGTDISTLSRIEMRPLRREMQVMFQDPYGSLNPRRRVGSIIGDPFAIHGVADGEERKRKVQELMELVGLNPEHYNRFPAEFSGGQRQRIGIARALALKPKLVVCDEPVSALDVSIQAQIINLLAELQDQLQLTYVFITHDLSVVRHVSDRIAVMYLGKIVEVAATEDLHEHTRHPYTRALLSAVPVADPDALAGRERVVLRGDLPSPAAPPSGCRFHPRCPKAQELCRTDDPELAEHAPGHRVACHFPLADGELLTLSKPTIDDLAPDLTFDPTAAEEGTS